MPRADQECARRFAYSKALTDEMRGGSWFAGYLREGGGVSEIDGQMMPQRTLGRIELRTRTLPLPSASPQSNKLSDGATIGLSSVIFNKIFFWSRSEICSQVDAKL